MSAIFINYRRKDASGYAGRLYDRLADHFGRDRVFMDIDQIEPGEDFHKVIDNKLKSVQVAVVLIGQHWLNITDKTGQRRLDNPDDWVRQEIAALLERNLRVIPVLVGDAVMPQSTELPDCLKPLARRHAYEISDQRFHSDADKLIQVLEKIMGFQSPSASTAQSVQPVQAEVEKQSINPVDQIHSNPTEHGINRHTNDEKPKSSNKLAVMLGFIGIMIGVIALYNDFNQDVEEPEWIADSASGIYADAPSPKKEQTPAKKVVPKAEPKNETTFEPEMVRIPGGTFLMGSPETEQGRDSDEGPQRKVTIATFEMSRFEITVGQFRQFVRDTYYRTTAEQIGKGCRIWINERWQNQSDRNWQNPGFNQTDEYPVVCISWDDAQAYATWLSKKTGKQYRLPTEAEWEYAARAGTHTARFYSDGKQCNYANSAGQETKTIADSDWILVGCNDPYVYTAPVGQFKHNPFDLFDMAGNVSEWVQDCWHKTYDNAPADDSAWLEVDGGDCNLRVIRGGSWYYAPRNLRSADRGRFNTQIANIDLGFRIARDF